MRIQNGLPCTKKLAKFGAARGADLAGVGAKDTESSGKERQIRRPFHFMYSCSGESNAKKRS
jgi:hypothetical protein